jgi:hypothetical protein
MIPLFLLEGAPTAAQMRITPSVGGAVAFFVVVGIVAAVLIFLNVSSRVRNSKVFQTGEVDVPQASPEEIAFQKEAERYHFNRKELSKLKSLLGGGRISPVEALRDVSVLDEVFKMHYDQWMREAHAIPGIYKEIVEMFELRSTIAFYHNALKHRTGVVAMRRYQRKHFSCPAECRVVIETRGRKNGRTVKKFILGEENFKAQIVDISAGGCSLHSNDMTLNMLLKVTWTYRDNQSSVLGQVVRIDKRETGSTAHVCFLDITPKSRSIIYAYIYGYDR